MVRGMIKSATATSRCWPRAFADAQFFYEQDRKQPLEAYLPRLETLTFHEKMGSMRDKSERLEKIGRAAR